MWFLSRNLSKIVARSSRHICQRRSIQTSSSAAGGGGHYSELTDYYLYLWDRPDGFPEGHTPHKEHFWERRGYMTDVEDYWMAILVGLVLGQFYFRVRSKTTVDKADEAVKVAEERFANGILIDLFPDQKEAKVYVNNREFFPDHNPHTYDPTVERDYFWIQ